MKQHLQLAVSLKTRLLELAGHTAAIENELRQPLSADFEEQASDLENQDALEALERAELQEMRQIQDTLNRIEEGTFGICVECGADIAPKRLKVIPTATRCIDCAA